MYVKKFYRDANFHGIFPVKPEKIIIKFSYFDRIKSRTHVHGSSYGFNNDDLIEIYINKSSWDNFNKAQRYHIMYHELGHDVLNLSDFDKNVQDKNAIMYPSASSGGYYLMDDFIVSMKRMFKNYKPTEKKIENKQKTLNGLKIVYPKGFTKISSDDTGEIFKNDNITIATVSGSASFGEKEALELIKSDLGGNKYIRHSVIEDFKIKFPIGHYLSSNKSIVTTSIFIINDNFYVISIEIKPKTSIQKLEDAQKIMKKGNLLIVEMITNFISEEDFTDAKHKELLSVYPIIKGKGWGRIIIGTKKNEVEEFLLDEGTLNSEHDNGYHIDYKKYGLQISYSFEDRVKFIAFFNNRFAYKYMNRISLKTNKNIDWNSTYKQVKEAYGKPNFDVSGDTDSFTYKTISFDDIDFVFENEKLVGINVYNIN